MKEKYASRISELEVPVIRKENKQKKTHFCIVLPHQRMACKPHFTLICWVTSCLTTQQIKRTWN